MRQLAAMLILVALFVLLVGSRFEHSDGDRLAAIGRLAMAKVRSALPPDEKLAGPVNTLRRQLPTRLEDRVKARLESDRKLEGIEFAVSADGGTVSLRGVVLDENAHARAVELTQTTVGVEHVVDEIAVPEK
ncbi:MAG TPA: BON domain-containing protein [Gemmataceae bacterium]|nr:BON domain-containing protein [Gemmataceae bacterium]